MTKEEMRKEKEFRTKYDGVIRSIAIAEDCDMGGGFARFTYELRVRLGMQEREDFYKGIPDSFEWKQAEADYKELVKK